MTNFVTYFDEVKPDLKAGRHTYRFGGLVVPFGLIGELETALDDLSEKTFGKRDLTKDTEFHATDIYSAKAAFKHRPAAERIAVLGELGRIIDAQSDVKRVTAAIHTDRLKHGVDPAPAAFAFFLERVQMAIGNDAKTLLIGDLDKDESNRMIREFSSYRSAGKTPWSYGIPTPGIVDAVHFTQSHLSRLVQLADAYLFLSTHRQSGRVGYMAGALTKEIEGLSFWPHRFKEWPPA